MTCSRCVRFKYFHTIHSHLWGAQDRVIQSCSQSVTQNSRHMRPSVVNRGAAGLLGRDNPLLSAGDSCVSGNVARMSLLSSRPRPQLLFSSWHWGVLASTPRPEGQHLPEPASPPLAQLTAVGYRLISELVALRGRTEFSFPI